MATDAWVDAISSRQNRTETSPESNQTQPRIGEIDESCWASDAKESREIGGENLSHVTANLDSSGLRHVMKIVFIQRPHFSAVEPSAASIRV